MNDLTPWDWMDRGLADRLGDTIFDTDEQARWCRGIFFGTLPYMWRGKAGGVRTIIFDRLALREGDKVLIIGEAVEGCGIDAEVRERIGPDGEIRIIDITEEARGAYMKEMRGRGGQLATWKWTYTDDVPDAYFDCVLNFQAVTHTDDWHETARELTRVMKPGRNIVLAEICIGPDFFTKSKLDIHIQTWIDKIFCRVGFRLQDFPYYSSEEIQKAFEGVVEDVGTFEWKGIELFWGTKL